MTLNRADAVHAVARDMMLRFAIVGAAATPMNPRVLALPKDTRESILAALKDVLNLDNPITAEQMAEAWARLEGGKS